MSRRRAQIAHELAQEAKRLHERGADITDKIVYRRGKPVIPRETCPDVSRGVGRFNFHTKAGHLVCRSEVKDLIRQAENLSQSGICKAASVSLKRAKELSKKDGCGPGPNADEMVERKMKAQGLMGLKRRRPGRKSRRRSR